MYKDMRPTTAQRNKAIKATAKARRLEKGGKIKPAEERKMVNEANDVLSRGHETFKMEDC